MVLEVELKNVDCLVSNTFEIESENYYMKKTSDIVGGGKDFELDGLTPSVTRTHTFKHPPQRKFTFKLFFPHLKNKRGVFIIHLLANNIKAIAVIRKGSLSLAYKPTSIGYVAYMLDQDRNICTPDPNSRTGVYFNASKLFYPANQTGRIVFPFPQASGSASSVLLHQNFAQFSNLNLITENYSFQVKFTLCTESLIHGNTAKILIHPKISIQYHELSLKLLENVICKLEVRNYVDDKVFYLTYSNIQFDEFGSYELEFEVPKYLQQVKVVILADIQKTNQDTKTFVSSSKVFDILKNEGKSEFFLQKKENGYYLYYLGKNGESIKNCNFNLELRLDFFKKSVIHHSQN